MCVCVCWVYISMCGGGSGGGKGEGGQVFALTRFNEGCVHVCVCACADVRLFAFCVRSVSMESTHPEIWTRGWKSPGLLCAPLRFLHSIFVRE